MAIGCRFGSAELLHLCGWSVGARLTPIQPPRSLKSNRSPLTIRLILRAKRDYGIYVRIQTEPNWEAFMVRLVTRGRFTQDYAKGLVAVPEDREPAVKKLIESVGAKLINFYFTTGDSDFLIVTEGDDAEIRHRRGCWQLQEPGRFRTYPLRELGQARNLKQSLKRLPRQQRRTRHLANTKKTCGSLLPFSPGFGRAIVAALAGAAIERSFDQGTNLGSCVFTDRHRRGGWVIW